MSTRQGTNAEKDAVGFLETHGLELIETNYRTRFGELDLLMWDGLILVCIEVKYRRHSRFGQAAEFVTAKKLQRMRTAFEQYLLDNGHSPVSTPVRIDVIAIDGDDFQWVKNVV
ncbi:YraN family protein [Alteromonas sp. H39]|uniref:YraN family protein n=1 Tax=Alteromonas sp. H39 TaxID=3389876 RepID=UPI0039E0C7B1